MSDDTVFRPTPKQKAELAQSLIGMTDMLEPMIEAAEGQRQKLEARGWSPTAAEAIALQILQGLIGATMSGISQNGDSK